MASPGLKNSKLNPTFDREQAFLLYATFCGDVEKTAHALGIPVAGLLKVVDEEGWTTKLAPIIELKKSNRPGDIERAINRALNFVQAHRYRMLLERALREMVGWNEVQLREALTPSSINKNGVAVKKFETRPLADFASALEKAHSLSYMALNDTATERGKRKGEEDDAPSVADMHARIAEAMSKVGASKTARMQLLDAQLEVVQAIAPAAGAPVDDTFEGDQH